MATRDRKSERNLEKIVGRLTTLRKSQGISHEKLADKTGLSRPTISYTESHKSKPSMQTVMRLCKGLDVKLSDLLREIGE